MTALPEALNVGARAIYLPSVFDMSRRQIVPMGPRMSVRALVESLVPQQSRSLAHVTINEEVVPTDLWATIRPKAFARVVVRIVPGKSNILRSVLLIAASVAAVALGQFYLTPFLAGPAIGLSAGVATAVSGVVTSAFAISDNFAIIAPPLKTRDVSAKMRASTRSTPSR